MKIKTLKLLLVFFLSAGMSSLAMAQRQTGSIAGTVADKEGTPLPGASVTLSGPALMGTLTYVTTEGGDFRFPAIPPGSDYVLTAQLGGFQTVKREGIIVNVGKTVTVAIQLTPAPIAEEITVTATPPTVDVTSSKLSVSYSSDLIRNIPLARDFYDVIKGAPSVVSEENYFHRSFSSQGGTVRSNQVSLDGVNMTDPFVGTNMISLPFDVFEEFEFELGSHPAEVGMTDGAYVNIVTKAGGNTFHGQATAYFFNKDMVRNLIPGAEAKAVGLSAPTGYKNWQDYSFSLGGPIVKDKLWFFLNGRYLDWTLGEETIVEGAFDLTYTQMMTFAKLTFKPHPNLQLTGMWNFVNTDEPILTGFGINYYDSKYTSPSVDNARVNTILGMVNWIMNQNTFFDARFNYWKKFDPWRMNPEIDPATPQYFDLFTGVTTGSNRMNEDYTSSRYQFVLSGTHFLDNFLGGNHEIKLGAEYEMCEYTWDWWKQNPYVYLTYQGLPWGLHNINPYMGIFYYGIMGANKGDTVPAGKLRRLSAYLQDSFTLAKRLTLNLGLRYDESRGDVPGGTYTPAGINNPVMQLLAPNIFKQTTLDDLKDTIVWKDFSPRIGAVFDVFGNGSTSLKGSWSRYNEYLMIQYFMVMNPMYPNQLASLWFDLNQNGIVEVADFFVPLYIPLDPSEYVLEDNLDPDLKSPYTNEFVVGLEHELFKDFRVGASYLYKKKQRIVEDVEKLRSHTSDSEWWVPYTVAEPGWDGQSGTSDDKQITVYGVKNGAPKSQFWFTNPKGAERKYQALEFIFEKRMSKRWQLLGSIVLSKFEGNIQANYADTWGYSGSFDNPNWFVNRYGRLGMDRPVQIKLQGSVMLPLDFTLSAYYYYMSGAPWTRTLRVYFPADPQFDSSNPQYVTVNADSPDGSRRLRARNNLDLRLEKNFRIGNFGTLGIFLDVLNALGESWYDVNEDPGGWILPNGTFQEWPTYRDITGVHGLRTFKLSARFNF